MNFPLNVDDLHNHHNQSDNDIFQVIDFPLDLNNDNERNVLNSTVDCSASQST